MHEMERCHVTVEGAHGVFSPKKIEHRKWATRSRRKLEEKTVVRTRVGSMRKKAALKALVGYLVVTQIQTDVCNSATKRALLRRSSSFMFLVMSMRYEYYGRDIRRIRVSIKRYAQPLHGSVHPCNGSSPRKATEGSGYFVTFLFFKIHLLSMPSSLV